MEDVITGKVFKKKPVTESANKTSKTMPFAAAHSAKRCPANVYFSAKVEWQGKFIGKKN